MDSGTKVNMIIIVYYICGGKFFFEFVKLYILDNIYCILSRDDTIAMNIIAVRCKLFLLIVY